MSRTALRLLTTAPPPPLAVGRSALPAPAHVSVSSPGATQGGFGVLTFRALLAGLVLGLGARRRRATVEQPDRETVPTGAK